MSTSPPGWYHAEGDPPGTQRYWNGVAWEGGPQPVAPAPVQIPYSYAQAWPESSQATTALVCSILGFVCCGFLGIAGWVLGQKELNAIDAGRRDPTNRGTATAAKIVGIVVVAINVLGLLAYMAFFAAVSTGPTPR